MFVAILAGGRSSRMGQDKALLRVGSGEGVPMLERVARAAMAVCPKLLVLGRDAAPTGWPRDMPAHFVPDPEPISTGKSGGPMPALIAALVETQAPILLLACDMPLLSVELLRLLIAAHEDSNPDGQAGKARPLATMGTSRDAGGRVYAESTLAIYTPAILPALRNLVHHHRGSFQPLLENPAVRAWEVPVDRAHELLNVNDAETLARVNALLG
jgi:molybdopterin-guanine dinucleotide biosynthesis protein A